MNMALPILQRLRDGISTQTPADMRLVAQQLADVLPPNTVLALHGDLGAGKTTFVAALGQALGVQEPITSPTFTLMHIYRGRYQLIHIDAYRLHEESALSSLCLEDLLEEPYCVAIEWASQIASEIPAAAWHVFFTHQQGHHMVQMR